MARPRKVTDEQILAAMKQAVLLHGPSVSLDQVASSLDVTAPALLKRFKSREALLLAALTPPDDAEFLAVLEAGATTGPLDQQLRRILTLMYAFLEDVIPCLSALRESGIEHAKLYRPKDPARGITAMKHWLATARKRNLIADLELEPAAHAILGAIQSRAFSTYLLQQPDSPRAQRKYIDEVVRFFTHALANPRPESSGTRSGSVSGSNEVRKLSTRR